MSDLPLTITEAAAAIRAGKLTSVELTTALLEKADHLDPILGTYITRMDVPALAAAKQADADFAAGVDKGPLQGIPIGIKDIIATRDAPTTAQSEVLDPNWGNGYDAPVTARLRAAGAVIIGKTSTMEFAVGMPDASKPFPVPRNPWNTDTWPGGSSSGSGSGVAAGLFLGALGTDTGGSIRIPAAFCGISGMKQTFGRVPKSGCVALGYSRDHIGPMARSAKDCAIMLKVLAGHDPSDLCSVDMPVPDYPAFLDGSLKGMKVGVERKNHFGHPAEDAFAKDVFEAAVKVFVEAGAEVFEVEVPFYKEVNAASQVAGRSESFAYHRLDLRNHRGLYGAHTKDILIGGALATGYEYVQTQRLRMFAKKAVDELMQTLDVLIAPATGAGAPPLEGLNAESFFTLPMYSSFWNTVGLPAICVPMGLASNGLPLSLQVVAKPFDEATAFKAADGYQQFTPWHVQVPAMAQAVLA